MVENHERIASAIKERLPDRGYHYSTAQVMAAMDMICARGGTMAEAAATAQLLIQDVTETWCSSSVKLK